MHTKEELLTFYSHPRHENPWVESIDQQLGHHIEYSLREYGRILHWNSTREESLHSQDKEKVEDVIRILQSYGHTCEIENHWCTGIDCYGIIVKF